MKYDGKELVEMTPEDWDGKSREMLVWCNSGICHIKTVVGYNPRKLAWVVDDKVLVYWPHCAEIPKEDLVESLKELLGTTPFEDALFTRIGELKVENEKLKNEVKELKNSCSYQVYSDMCKEKEKYENKIANLNTENEELEEEIADLKEENERLKNELDERIKNELRKQIKKEMDLVYEERYLD